MDPASTTSLARALLVAAVFVLLLAVVVAVARRKRIPLPVAPPAPRVVALWVGLFAVAAFVQEAAGALLGGTGAPAWDALTPARAVRATTIVLLAPLAEEVALRGTMYGNLVKRGASPAVVILLPAAVFALLHLQYAGPGLAWIFADGVIFGLARHRTRSLFVPILLHALGNAYAVAERMGAGW